ncbi:hypothetical protein [uncultured Methanobrevibacter sp.]|uniref:hypothetical protein n=1 Tax=uncultured Methanobrevibacter sp. TaxID=253161 RepID=UPI0025E5F116|nr:hypothetical protein [uncultured Methanobrevibacter sp.]
MIPSFFKRKVNQAKYPLTPVEPTHRVWTIFDELEDLWVCNKTAIGIVIIAVCCGILIFMMGYAAATGHIHMFSTEANQYEHLNQIILFYGGGLL